MKKTMFAVFVIVLGVFAFTACGLAERIGNEFIEVLRDELDIAVEPHMVTHTDGRLSVTLPSDFREVFEPERRFIRDGVIVLLNRIENDAGVIEGMPIPLMVWATVDAYASQGFELTDGSLGGMMQSRNMYMNGAMWRNVHMVSQDMGRAIDIYMMSSGTEYYSITFATDINPSDADLALVQQIFSTVTFDDSHHKAELEGLWRGVNDGYGYMVFDGDRFYWFLAYQDMDNVLIGNYHVMKGFPVTETSDSLFRDFIHRPIGTEIILESFDPDRTFHPNGYMMIVYYTDVFFNGENMTELFFDAQSFTFVPHDDNDRRFTVHVQDGNQQMVFERAD